ncbi:hypothetical protein ABLG96_01525 [Nakamurella sp. A5-74]|uniref:Uncharacterized protein n=1 Tax=Nakamurella sp. A5-74 TaxID=3158264 RepID=A0AAU8DRT0_9ACTN
MTERRSATRSGGRIPVDEALACHPHIVLAGSDSGPQQGRDPSTVEEDLDAFVPRLLDHRM